MTKIIKGLRSKGKTAVMVGGGANSDPAFASADIPIAAFGSHNPIVAASEMALNSLSMMSARRR